MVLFASYQSCCLTKEGWVEHGILVTVHGFRGSGFTGSTVQRFNGSRVDRTNVETPCHRPIDD